MAMNRSHGHNLGKSALFLVCIFIASCEKAPDGSKPFDAARDAGFVAECYAAHLDTLADPDEISILAPDDAALAARVGRAQGIKEKIKPFVAASADAVGPDYVKLVAKKSVQNGDLALNDPGTSKERYEVLLKSNLDRLDKCSDVIDRWNAHE